jgi:hypothetical protein
MPLPPRPVAEFTLCGSDSASCYGAFDNLVVVLGGGPPSASNVQLFSTVVKGLAAKYPKGAGVLLAVQSDSTPTPDGRDALLAMFRDVRNCVSSAFVLESSGFATAAQRAIITAMLLVTPFRDSIRIERSFEAGARWLSARVPSSTGQPWDEASLVRAARAFCQLRIAHRRSARGLAGPRSGRGLEPD